VASFGSTASGLSVAFDGSASSDPDGSIASYAWDFGDGSTGSGVRPSHTYAAAGTYTARLTVTDNAGATGTTTRQVAVTAPSSSAVSFVGAAHSAPGAATYKAATVPTSARAGDTMLLFLTRNSAASWGTPTGVTGWTQVDSFTNGSIVSTLWKKTVAAGDPGATVRVNATTYTKGVLSLGVYRGADVAALTAARAGDANTAAHRSPTLTAPAGSWAVSYWAEKSSGTTAWTAPGGVSNRDTSTDTGSGRFGSLLADSGSAVPAGTYGGLTATTNATSSNGTTWTITVPPAP
jgi:PKD repeat protein